MKEMFVWKANVTFKGNAEQFAKMVLAMKDLPIEVEIPEWEGIDDHLDGCMRVATRMLFSDEMLDQITQGMPRFELEYLPQDICGGIRTAHIHLGDEIVLLDQERFRTYVGHVARALAERRVERIGDYVHVMRAVGDLASM